jgi:hypothetical protein
MRRFLTITLIALAALTAASTLTSPALARGGGGMGMGHAGGMGMGHAGGMGMGMGHVGFAHMGPGGHVGGFTHMGGWNHMAGHPVFIHGGHFHHFVFRHRRFFGPSFAFVGAPYIYDDGCYRQVWTRWGWRWVSVCY